MSNYLNPSKAPIFHGDVPTRFLPDFPAIGRNILETLVLWNKRTKERQALKGLDDRLLKDVGISKYDADLESGKPFWIK